MASTIPPRGVDCETENWQGHRLGSVSSLQDLVEQDRIQRPSGEKAFGCGRQSRLSVKR